jgi:uncharacterized protein
VRLDFAGRTAVVTGASAGIGREIARLLGAEVSTLILVARRQDRLEELSAELTRGRSDLRVLSRAVDLTDRAETRRMLDGLEREGIGVDVFINNAGLGIQGLFEQRDWSKIEQMLELNMVSATHLLHWMIPPMVARGFGAILNVGSTAGMVPYPGMAAYGATKAYLNQLSESLRAELAGTGVVVTALCPGPVATEFQEVAGSEGKNPLPKFAWVSARACAEEGLSALKKGKARVVPGPARALSALEAVPKPLLRPALARMGAKIRRG